MTIKTKLFKSSSMGQTNKEIAEFLETENANVVDVKIAVAQSQISAKGARCFVALIYSKNPPN